MEGTADPCTLGVNRMSWKAQTGGKVPSCGDGLAQRSG